MSDKLARRGRKAAYRLVAFQTFIVLAVALFSWINWGGSSGWSAFMGGCIFLIPNFLFTVLSFAFAGARQAELVVRAMFLGEALKFLLIIVMFTLVLTLLNPVHLYLFSGFTLAALSQWCAPFFFKQQ